MKADGTKIAERWAPMYKNAMAISEERPQTAASALAGVVTETIEELSAAEERERVLRDALEEIRELAMTFALVGNESQRALSESVIGILRRAALATPAAEHPAGMPEMPKSWATSDPEAAMQAYADACADAEQPAEKGPVSE